jgi:starch-binding outer membrane protein, SusD/RagB family
LNYSQLRNIFCSTNDNAYQAQLEPSDALTDLSEAQVYCNYNTANEVVYVPDDLPDGGRGDLRLNSIVLGYTTNYDNTYRQAQEIYKFSLF